MDNSKTDDADQEPLLQLIRDRRANHYSQIMGLVNRLYDAVMAAEADGLRSVFMSPESGDPVTIEFDRLFVEFEGPGSDSVAIDSGDEIRTLIAQRELHTRWKIEKRLNLLYSAIAEANLDNIHVSIRWGRIGLPVWLPLKKVAVKTFFRRPRGKREPLLVTRKRG